MHHTLYPNLLSPIKIGNVVFKNRLFSSPSMPHYHQEAGPFTGENLIAHFAGRAKGGAALVTCSGTKIYPKSDITDHFIQLDINDPQVHVFLSQMVDAIHLYGAKASIILDSPKREGYDVVAGIPSHSVAGDDSKSSLGKDCLLYTSDAADEARRVASNMPTSARSSSTAGLIWYFSMDRTSSSCRPVS